MIKVTETGLLLKGNLPSILSEKELEKMETEKIKMLNDLFSK